MSSTADIEGFGIEGVADVRLEEGSCLTYLYDFGDHWLHDLVVEDVMPSQPTTLAAIAEGLLAGRFARS